MTYKYDVGILGAGAWGTALAQHLAERCGHDVWLWSYEKNTAKEINKKHTNTGFLPEVNLSERIKATTSAKDIIKNCKTILFATPSAHCQEMATVLAPLLSQDQVLVICAKGFRESDGGLLSDVWMEANPTFKNIAVLSGPTFAHELAQKKPVTATLAADDDAIIKHVDGLFSSPTLRLYFSNDIISAQVGGALKNTIAIVAGVSDGLQMGEGFKAALLCRGLVEMMRYSKHLGGQDITLAGLSGMGDLIMTATPGSRNYRFGSLLGEGKTVAEALEEVNSTIEGISTAGIVTMQGISNGIDMGVVMAAHGIVSGDLNPKRTFEILLARPRVYEFSKENKMLPQESVSHE